MILSVVSQLRGDTCARIDFPDRSIGGDGEPLPVRRPGGCPRSRAGRGRNIVVKHVIPAMLGGGIGCLLRPADSGSTEQNRKDPKRCCENSLKHAGDYTPTRIDCGSAEGRVSPVANDQLRVSILLRIGEYSDATPDTRPLSRANLV